jgi:tetratricopeptide (TPR) repeat protein
MKKIIIYLLLPMMLSCGGGNIGETIGPAQQQTIYDIVRDGWYYYELSQYDLALSKFTHAANINNTFEDAFNGLGWTYLALQNITVSMSNFEKMTTLNSTLIDGWIGKAFANFELGMYEESNNSINTAISTDSTLFDLIIPDYIFSHNIIVNQKAVRTIMALNYFYLGDFEQSYFILRKYLNNVSLNTNAKDFPEKLLKELEKL